jgi:hypothetical protein
MNNEAINFAQTFNSNLKNTLSGSPYKATKEGSVTILRFFSKSPNAKDPNQNEFTLRLNEIDRPTLIKLLS